MGGPDVPFILSKIVASVLLFFFVWLTSRHVMHILLVHIPLSRIYCAFGLFHFLCPLGFMVCIKDVFQSVKFKIVHIGQLADLIIVAFMIVCSCCILSFCITNYDIVFIQQIYFGNDKIKCKF